MIILEPSEDLPGIHQATPLLSTDATSPKANRSLRLRLLGLDLSAILVSWIIATALFSGTISQTESAYLGASIAAAGLLIIIRHELYLARVSSVRTVEMARILKSSLWITASAYLLIRVFALDRALMVLLSGAILTLLLLLSGRSIFRVWLTGARAQGRYCRDIILIGANSEALELTEFFKTHPECGLVVQAVMGDAREAKSCCLTDQYGGEVDNALALAKQIRATGVVIATSAFPAPEVNRIAREFLAEGFHVQLTSTMQGIHHRRLRAQPVAYEPMFYFENSNINRWNLGTKRVLDTLMASALLIFSGPAILIFGVAIKLQDRGPMFFSQERVGKDNKPFQMHKLRTMVTNAPQLKAELEELNEREGALFKIEHDPRFTRLGRALDATSLNELPQLWNVVRGDMSLVGPRPALAAEFETFDSELRERNTVRPGITGLWQVEGRDNPSPAAYKRFDLFYIENWSLSLDLMILVATAEVVAARALRFMSRMLRPQNSSQA